MTSFTNKSVAPFKITVDENEIRDLKDRLKRTRWPDEALGAEWLQGTSLSYMKQIVSYWMGEFSWQAQELRLNRFPQFIAQTRDWNVHFVHVKSRSPESIPILVLHGWPDSFAGMLKLVPFLSDPAASGGKENDLFDVVIPSLPGYGFSDKQTKLGWVNRAEILHALMTEVLGYRKFAVQGGDVGAGVATDIAYQFPDSLIGIHINNDFRMPVPMPERSELTPPEQEYVKLLDKWELEEGAYGHMQRTKPQTIAYGLNDSPVALAAYIIEKFRAWGDTGGNVETRFTKDELLTTVMIYWATQTMASSMRGYYEGYHSSPMLWRKGKVNVPMAAALFANDYVFPYPYPRELGERVYGDIRRWAEMPSGGHFAAAEEPKMLAEEVRAFFTSLRS